MFAARARVHRGRLFAVTAPYTEVDKQFVFDSLEDTCHKLCVSEEKHYNGLVHHHIYMKTIESFTLAEIKRIIGIVYDTDVFAGEIEDEDHGTPGVDDDEIAFMRDIEREHGIHVTKVRSERNYLKYITKEDCNPLLKNISSKTLSFYMRAIEWAKNTPEYQAADPFILGHPQYHNLLKQVHASVHATHLRKVKQPLRPYQPRAVIRDSTQATSSLQVAQTHALQEWEIQVIQWWNDWVSTGFRPKKKQLYLWGPSNTGKSHLINKILKQCIPVEDAENQAVVDDEYAYEEHVYRPTPHDDRFAWEGFDERKFSVMVIDEFETKDYNVNDLKKILEGQPVVAGRKGASSRRIRLQMPMIIISNNRLPDESLPGNSRFTGLNSRFRVVSTHQGYIFDNN